jgi:hypothetical protein
MKVAVILLLALAAVAQARELTSGGYGHSWYSDEKPIYCKYGYHKDYRYNYYGDDDYYGGDSYGHGGHAQRYNAYDYYGYEKCPYGYECAPLYKPVCKQENVCHYDNYNKKVCKYQTVCWYHKCVEETRYCDPYAHYDECEKKYGYGYECKPYNYGHDYGHKKECKKEKYCKRYNEYNNKHYGYDGYNGYQNDKCYEWGYRQNCYYNKQKYWQGMCEKTHHGKTGGYKTGGFKTGGYGNQQQHYG